LLFSILVASTSFIAATATRFGTAGSKAGATAAGIEVEFIRTHDHIVWIWCGKHSYPTALKHPDSFIEQFEQIVEGQLRVINPFLILTMPNSGTRNLKGLAYSIQVKADYSWSQTHRRDATLASQTSHCRFAHLQNFGKLTCSEKLFAIVH